MNSSSPVSLVFTLKANLGRLMVVTKAGFFVFFFSTGTTNGQESIFEWEMQPRYQLGWESYDEHSGLYDPAYVNPAGWLVDFVSDSSLGTGRTIVTYSWNFTQEETVEGGLPILLFEESFSRDIPELSVELPNLGKYTVELVVTDDQGTAVVYEDTVMLTDRLIVSIGDSYSSGEGNPDIDGIYLYTPQEYNELAFTDPEGFQGVIAEEAFAVWQDEDCHRSAKSGPALATAKIEEQDPHSSVTFLSFACSGAKIAEDILGLEFGILADTGEYVLVPLDIPKITQIDQIVTNVGGGSDPDAREIDALLISGGVNDLNFTDILKWMIKYQEVVEDSLQTIGSGFAGDDPRGSVSGILANMERPGGLFDQMADKIRERFKG